MAAEWRIQEQMLQTVADALGPELARQQPAREELIFQRLEAIAVPPAHS